MTESVDGDIGNAGGDVEDVFDGISL